MAYRGTTQMTVPSMKIVLENGDLICLAALTIVDYEKSDNASAEGSLNGEDLTNLEERLILNHGSWF
ncbi:25891_t:CDS:2 [Dentiscutata erythropus]|uniref:25891_t:CDS:1 n=1 Tax=Dentiscutata erythropus TaxID=1348616 RepID=A0A9N9CAM8_9GLOM|nr:25891_t:CDS:2 [Dentiscutata erythropus]